MNPLEYKKTLFTLATIAVVWRTVYRFLEWRKKKPTAKEFNEVIMFSESAVLVSSKHSVFRSIISTDTDRILYYLSRARYTLDICMYNLNNREISLLIQKLYYTGVKIRYIVDAESAYLKNSETKRLLKENIIVLRCKKSRNIMHHKFCIIDASANDVKKKVVPFIMMGSLNWTNQALQANWESVVVMSEPKIVQLYKKGFEQLWLQFAPPPPLQHPRP